MSDLVGNPEDRFSHNEALLITEQYQASEYGWGGFMSYRVGNPGDMFSSDEISLIPSTSGKNLGNLISAFYLIFTVTPLEKVEIVRQSIFSFAKKNKNNNMISYDAAHI